MNTHIASLSLLLAIALAPSPAPATPNSLTAEDGWIPLPEEVLDEMRGGFDLPSGMELSFGFQRVVEINGEIVAQTRLHISDIARLTPSDIETLASINHGMTIQVGDGNTFTPTAAGNGLVIQNTLNNQDIRVATTLNVSVGTLDLFQSLNTHAALQDALITAPGGF